MYSNFELKKTDSCRIEGYLWDIENAEGVVCIVHGIGEYGGRFDRVASELNRHGLAVVSMDLRGHGKSSGNKGHCAPRKDVLGDVSDLIRYAQEKYPGKKIVLYGHSMGGNITLDYRERGSLNDVPVLYIISAPWVKLVRPVPKPVYLAVKLLSLIAPALTISSSVDESILGNPESVKPYSTDPMVHNRISLLCAVDGFETGLKLEKGTLENDHGASGTPVLLMHGDEDRICDVEGSRNIAKRLQADGEDVTYIEWPGLYHEIHNGGSKSRGDEVIEMITAWAEKYTSG